jgi:energy-coupling factor transporter ATP-binding protein EcfA2
MVSEELLAWSNQESRPAWQKDALRRLAMTGELTDDDLTALQAIIKKEVDLIKEETDRVIPLSSEHLTNDNKNTPRTILGSIGPVRRVDRLASDQPPIRFAKRGITLIYGANGSGKSGYCRIAKQLCRSLSPKELKGNVFEAPASGSPEIDLTFGVEQSEIERHEITWRSGDPPPQELARVSVFDTETARVYVDKNRKIELLPYELDLLNKLALAAKLLDGAFEKQENTLNAAIRTPLPAGYNSGTLVGRTLAKLLPNTEMSDLPSGEALRGLAEWNIEKEGELQRIVDEISSDPSIQFRLHRTAKQTLENIKAELGGYLELLNDIWIGRMAEAHQEKVTNIEAAEAAARGLGDGLPIPEIGSASWRKMLVYAREFAGEVFDDLSDPKLVTANKCVLCQQPLSDDALMRITAFDQYISGRAESDAAEATRAYNQLVTQLTKLRVKTSEQFGELLAAFTGSGEDLEVLTDQIKNGEASPIS